MITATPGQNDYSDFVSNNLNQSIYFPKGIYPFKSLITIVGKDKLSITGDGPGLTQLTDFNLDVKTNENSNNLYLNISNVKILGDLRGAEVSLADCCYVLIENVLFDNTNTTKLLGVWDSVFRNVHFTNGNGLLIDRRIGKLPNQPNGDSSNCISIIGGRFESCTGIPLVIKNSKKIIIDGTKFHGILPTPLPIDHLYMENVICSMIKNCNFTVCGKSYVNLNNCNRINFDNIMDNPYEYAFDITNSDKIVIDGIIQAKKITNVTKGATIRI